MKYCLAPMEGITTYIYRNAYHDLFGGIDRYYTPFLASRNLSFREKEDILPEHNKGMDVIPQILTNKADEFLDIAEKVAAFGYKEVNLNLGCPSGTVVSKHRGAGFLGVPEELDRFLDEIFSKCPMRISIKTRIGVIDEAEWEPILRIYEKYPISELIVHTRLQKDFYKEPTRPKTFAPAMELGIPVCYNGDIFSVKSLLNLQKMYPTIDNVMIGRWILRDPNLVLRMQGKEEHSKQEIATFMNRLMNDYMEQMDGGERVTLYKMKEIWVYLGNNFVDSQKYVKKIMKSDHLSEYKIAMNNLIRERELISEPKLRKS